MCYAECFDILVILNEDKEIEAMKFGRDYPVKKLSGTVGGHVIKPDALTSDAEGNVYISDKANDRILKINGLTGKVLKIIKLEGKKKKICCLLWSDTEPNLTLI